MILLEFRGMLRYNDFLQVQSGWMWVRQSHLLRGLLLDIQQFAGVRVTVLQEAPVGDYRRVQVLDLVVSVILVDQQ